MDEQKYEKFQNRFPRLLLHINPVASISQKVVNVKGEKTFSTVKIIQKNMGNILDVNNPVILKLFYMHKLLK